MKKISEIIESKNIQSVNSSTDNSKKKDEITVNSITVTDKITTFLAEEQITPEGIAIALTEKLADPNSKDYYVLLAKENPSAALLEALSYTLDADRKGKIRTKKAIYFMAILRRWGFKTKFRSES